MKTIRLFLIPAFILLLTACGTALRPADEGKEGEQEEQTICVSILPLKAIAEAIVGEDYPVAVLVPAGASPETFEPTPKQIIGLNRARLILSVGLLDFEQNLLGKVEHGERIADLSRGIDLIAGSCSHSHAGHRHAHGIDPHIWTSPRELQTMARNAYEAIHALHPDSAKYTANYELLAERLRELDREVADRIRVSGLRYFLIYHPALTYYARAYGIEQLAIEQEGKEPSARRLARLIERGRRDGIRTVLYQSQFPASSVEVIARDLEGRSAAIDPLAEDVIENIGRITDLICSGANN